MKRSLNDFLNVVDALCNIVPNVGLGVCLLQVKDNHFHQLIKLKVCYMCIEWLSVENRWKGIA